MNEELLLEVKDSFSLTGLGVMLLPAGAVAALDALELHTVWAVELRWPDGHWEAAIASVEEITRHGEAVGIDATQERGLLLTHKGAAPVAAGTRVYRRAGAEM